MLVIALKFYKEINMNDFLNIFKDLLAPNMVIYKV